MDSNNNQIDDVENFDDRPSWKQGSFVLVYSRSNNKWYEGRIAGIFIDNGSEWLSVQYNKNKKKKTMQRNCKHLKPIPFNHILSLKKNSFCLIHSDETDTWFKGKVISVFYDNEGEWLKIKYSENDKIKICDVQRDSKQLKPFLNNKNKKQRHKNGINTSKNIKPSLLQKKWNMDNFKNNMKKIRRISPPMKPFTKIVEISKSFINDTHSKKNGVEPGISIKERKKEIIRYLQCDMDKQHIFDSFILDNKTKEGRIINQWLSFINKKENEITFKDLMDFIQKIAHTFIHSYALETDKYYSYILLSCYRCILRQNIVKKIVYNLLNKHILDLDEIYQKKVMWMRALNKDQLGIKHDYWIKKVEYKENNNKQQKRRLSQIGLMAGDDVAFAEAINLTGKLQISNKTIIKWENQLTLEKNEKRNMSKIPFLSLNNHRKSSESKREKVEKKEQEDIIPFILPMEGLSTLIAATKCMESTAIKYFYEYHSDKKEEADGNSPCISQDILLPIIIYCVIQSKLETPNRLIYFIENILPNENITMGQSAWALSQLKAAVKYIQKAKPQIFGMDNEIELD